MKKIALVLVFAVFASCPLQATPGNGVGVEALGWDPVEMIRHTMEQFGLSGRVREEQDRVVVCFPVPGIATDWNVQLEQRGEKLVALICSAEQNSKVLVTCPIPPLPCPVAAGSARYKITSPNELQVIFHKARPSVSEVSEVPQGLLS